MIAQPQRLISIAKLLRIVNIDRLQFIAVKLDRSIKHLGHCLNLNVISMIVRMTLTIHIVGDILGDELLEILAILKNIVHSLLSNEIVHFLIAIELKTHRSEQTIAILFHVLDNQALLEQQRIGERLVALLPLIVAETVIVADVLVATIVARHLLLGVLELDAIGGTACANTADVLVICAEFKFSCIRAARDIADGRVLRCTCARNLLLFTGLNDLWIELEFRRVALFALCNASRTKTKCIEKMV